MLQAFRPDASRMPARILTFTILLLAATSAAFASGPYTVGSSNTVTAAPRIVRPSTKPCTVTLFRDYTFDNNYNLNPYSYTPPEECPGPWAKVVLEVDISVDAGNQYDRTANIWLGGTNIYFGTTAEPGATLAPSWHVEKDLTEYTPLFTIAQSGSVYLGNTVTSTFTSIQTATAKLQLYPLASGQTAPVTANVVLPLSSGPDGGTVNLNSSASTLAGTFTFPTNIQNAYLEVFSEPQIDDEFWYTCVPNDLTTELNSCGNTAFRETEISIDGTPAGVAPVSPWIFTGGIDPLLWFPLPGVQTLNFAPYRIDLTPFAATLNNGQQHTVSLSVFNANNWFADTATLLLYLDSGSTVVTGAVTENTLSSGPNPVVSEHVHAGKNTTLGTVKVVSDRAFAISGYLNTSHGKVTTTISQSVSFSNSQDFEINNSEYKQFVTQTSGVKSTTTILSAGKPTRTIIRDQQFPLNLDLLLTVQPNGNINQATTSLQTYNVQDLTKKGGVIDGLSLLTNTVSSQDTLELNSSETEILGNFGQASSQSYSSKDVNGTAYVCQLTAANNALTSFSPTCSK